MHDLHEISQDVIRRGSGDLNFNDITSCKEFCESIATDYYAALQFNPGIGCECIFIKDTIPVTPQQTESFKISSGWIRPSVAWYKSGTFDLENEIWPNALDGQRDGAFLNGTLGIASLSGHGATRKVTALHGSTSASINFGDIIKDRFTICSVTRYTDGVKEQILHGGADLNWIHGHFSGMAGVARYGTGTWHTHTVDFNTVEPNTNWVVLCGTNAGSQLKLVNGVDKSNNNNAVGQGGTELVVNEDQDKKSDFAIAEVMVWDRGLTSDEMDGVSFYLMNKFGITPGESAGVVADPPVVPNIGWFRPGSFNLYSKSWLNHASGAEGTSATLHGDNLIQLSQPGSGASEVVTALSGTAEDSIDFGDIVKTDFTICSVSRYTGAAKQKRILQGEGQNWLHGHYSGNAGVARYGGWSGWGDSFLRMYPSHILLAPGHSAPGFFFKIQAKADIDIIGFTVFRKYDGLVGSLRILNRAGDFEGFEYEVDNNASSWSGPHEMPVGSGGQQVKITLPDVISVPSGHTHSFYINSTLELRYFDATADLEEGDHMVLPAGKALLPEGPSGPRSFHGIVNYRIAIEKTGWGASSLSMYPSWASEGPGYDTDVPDINSFGYFFKIQAKTDIEVVGFTVLLQTTGPGTLEIRNRDGTFQGFESLTALASSWSEPHEMSVGSSRQVKITLPDVILVQAGQTHSFHVSSMLGIEYAGRDTARPGTQISKQGYVFCGKRESGYCDKMEDLVDLTEEHAVRCCSTVSGQSTCDSESDFFGVIYGSSPNDCLTQNYYEAKATCENSGRRLCTREEMEASCSQGTGCGFDWQLVWADALAPASEEGDHMVLHGGRGEKYKWVTPPCILRTCKIWSYTYPCCIPQDPEWQYDGHYINPRYFYGMIHYRIAVDVGSDAATNISPNTNWVVMCGTNAESHTKLANGGDVNSATSDTGEVKLWVNGGNYARTESSDFAIAEVMVWDRGLTFSQINETSYFLMEKYGIGSFFNPVVDSIVGSSTRVDLLSNREVFCQDGLECIAILPSVEMDKLQDGWSYIPVKDECVSRIILLPLLPISRPCSHNQTKHKNDSLQRDT